MYSHERVHMYMYIVDVWICGYMCTCVALGVSVCIHVSVCACVYIYLCGCVHMGAFISIQRDEGMSCNVTSP